MKHRITYADFYNRLSGYQKTIINAMIAGSMLCSGEGRNYKTWLLHKNGSTEIVRRDSVEKLCSLAGEKYMVFGNPDGITIR